MGPVLRRMLADVPPPPTAWEEAEGLLPYALTAHIPKGESCETTASFPVGCVHGRSS